MLLNPTIDQFKIYFSRDFPFGTDQATSVLDADIAKAFIGTNCAINQDLFSTQDKYSMGYLLLSAHNLVMNLRASSQGLSGKYPFLEVSKNVGSVAQAFQIPQRILDNPIFAYYCNTNYGAQFLHMILPLLSGQVFIAYGTTQA